MLDFTGLCLISLIPVLGLNDLYLFSLDDVGSHWPVPDLIALCVGLTCLCWVPLVSMRFSLISVAFHWSILGLTYIHFGSHYYLYWILLVCVVSYSSVLGLTGLCIGLTVCVGSQYFVLGFSGLYWIPLAS